MKDGWLSWPCWLTDSGRLKHKVVTHPPSSLAQDRESSLAETSVLTTILRRQHTLSLLYCYCLRYNLILFVDCISCIGRCEVLQCATETLNLLTYFYLLTYLLTYLLVPHFRVHSN